MLCLMSRNDTTWSIINIQNFISFYFRVKFSVDYFLSSIIILCRGVYNESNTKFVGKKEKWNHC